MKSAAVQLSLLSDGDRTVVEAAYHSYQFPSIVASASSGREPGDKSNEKIGEALAVARALRSLANRLERQAQGALRHAESNKAHKEEIRAKAIHAYTTGQYDPRPLPNDGMTPWGDISIENNGAHINFVSKPQEPGPYGDALEAHHGKRIIDNPTWK